MPNGVTDKSRNMTRMTTQPAESSKMQQSCYKNVCVFAQTYRPGYGVDGPEIESRQGENIFLLQNVQTVSEAQPSCNTMATGALRCRFKRPGLATHLHLMPGLRMNGAIPLLPLYTFKAWTGTSPFTCRKTADSVLEIQSQCYHGPFLEGLRSMQTVRTAGVTERYEPGTTQTEVYSVNATRSRSACWLWKCSQLGHTSTCFRPLRSF